jgi:hypothetical protein
MFADGAGWDHPIRVAGGVGGHMDVVAVAHGARRLGVKRLGELAADGQMFLIGPKRLRRRPAWAHRR